jgi:hypothetical protein
MKLDLGAGEVSPDGYTALGNRNGSAIYPLPFGDASIDAIRASHVLEHFPHREVPKVLAEWARVLKPGGEMRIAVPDFAKIAKNYLDGVKQPTEAYIYGGQIDDCDFHHAAFDEDTLKRALAAAGLVLIRQWRSELNDCAALPISLNLYGIKPHATEISAAACISLPRVTWTDNSMVWVEAFTPLNIPVRASTGAYWGQCLERCMEESIEESNPDLIFTLDYDTVCRRRDVSILMQLMMVYPQADAIAPIQAARGKDFALFTVHAEDGKNVSSLPASDFASDLKRAATAHFGMTVFRTEKLKALPKPWFHGVPAPDGTWHEGRRDDDVAFWDKWAAAGHSLFMANRVPVGHLELMVKWPGPGLGPIYQESSAWRATRLPPKDVWK